MKKIIFIFLVLQSCVYDPKKPLYSLKVINKTDLSFYVYTSCKNKISELPAIKYDENRVSKIVPGFEKPSIKENGSTYIYDYSIESFFKNCDNEKLNVFLIKDSVIQNYSWKDIYEEQIYFKKISFTKDYLKDRNFIEIDSTILNM